MAGQGAYNVNGPPVVGINCSKKFVIYGFNFERIVGCMLENTSHMTENIMLRHALNWPRKWSFNVYTEVDAWRNLKQRQRNEWEIFVLTDVVNYPSFRTDPEAFLMAPGFAQIGTAHYPPNAAYNYGWHWINESFYNDSRWVAVSGQWSLGNGVYSADGGYGKSLMYDSPDRPYFASNFVMESDIKIHSASSTEGAGFIFRYNKYSSSANSGSGYYVGFNPELSKVIAAKINNNFSVIDSSQVDFSADEWHHIKIVAMRDSISVFLDDMSFPVLVVEDTSFYDGAFGFATYQTEVSFDNLFVNTYAITYADAWYNYPDFSFSSSRMVNSYDWAGRQDDWFCWWFEHIPKNSGTHDGGILNSWWPYILDINRFDQAMGYSNIIFPDKDNQPPDPPLNLTARVNSTHSIALYWQEPFDNIGVTRYEIYRDNKMIQQVSRTQFTDTGLKPGAIYTYTVKARDGSANVSEGVSLTVQTEGGTNYDLINGDFELSSENLPFCWIYEAFNNVAVFQWEAGTGRNNSHCVSIDIPSDQLDDARWIQEIQLLPNKTYKLTGWIKGENITLVQGNIGANLCVMGGFEHSPSLSGTFDWQKTELEFTTPANGIVTIGCRLGFYGSILHGKAWFDDLTLTLLDSTVQFAGNVKYDHSQKPIPDADIYVDDQAICTTNSAGQFSASDISVGTHTVSVMKEKTEDTAISGADVLMLMKNLAFLITLNDDQKIAADVTKDGDLSGADVQAMMRHLAFFTTNTSHTGEWRFFPEDTTIDFSEDTNVDFVGYLLGDVNLSWSNSALLSKNGRNGTIFDLKFGAPEQSETAEISIPLILNTSDEKMNTLLFSMTYPASALKFKRVEWTRSLSSFQKVINSEKEGKLHLAMAGVTGISFNEAIGYLVFEKNAVQRNQLELQFTRAIVNDKELKDLPILILNQNPTHVPDKFALQQNFPNPFNSMTIIQYQLPQKSEVDIAIYNCLGQRIKTLICGKREAGCYQIIWNGKDEHGKEVGSGIYFYYLKTRNHIIGKKMVVIQ
ncbi:MAG: T9SS type A sorting domain-containing protein [Calditrichaeota bacterium]|nr:T9SS type A sorting domain-containing protein [Calditrichota bacterium]